MIKVARTCSPYRKDYTTLDAAKTACNGDTRCAYLSTNNRNCKGPFDLCYASTLGFDPESCILHKGQ